MTTLLHIANPLHRRGFYALPHLLVIAAAVVIVYLAGFFSGVRYGEGFFRAHYIAPQPVPRALAPVPVVPRALPAAATINLSLYPAVGDQGPLGACAAWASTYALSYSYRVAHPLTGLRRFSPRYAYNHYSDTYSGGQDGGSWPDQDLEQVNTTGLLRWTAMPYGGSGWGGHPGYAIDNPQPAIDAHGRATSFDAAKQKFPITIHAISGFSADGGQGLVDAIHAAIAAGHPVMIALPVYPEFDNATNTGGLIDVPSPGESSRGGHEIVILGYDTSKRFASGNGGELVQNQWNTWWGDQGRGWLSDAFVRQYVYGAEYITIGASAPLAGPNRPADGGHKLVPAPTTRPSVPRPTANLWGVRDPLWAADRHYDLAPLFNRWGNHFGISPFGLAATFASECGLKTGVNGDCNRIVFPYDISGGGCQITVGTAQSVGVGDGSSSNANIARVFKWEDEPANCVWGEARLMRGFSDYRGGAIYSPLSILWNCGPATLEYPFPTPGTQCATNYYGDFLPWYQYSAAHWATGYVAPTPKTRFNKRVWNEYRVEHHRSVISFRFHGRLSWAASIWRHIPPSKIGGILHYEHWYGPSAHQRHGFTKNSFQGAAIFTHPFSHSANVRYHRWIR